jgi:hypothetical protein
LTNFEDVSPIVLDVEGNMLFLMILEYAEKSPVLQDKEKIYCLLHSDICSEKKTVSGSHTTIIAKHVLLEVSGIHMLFDKYSHVGQNFPKHNHHIADPRSF